MFRMVMEMEYAATTVTDPTKLLLATLLWQREEISPLLNRQHLVHAIPNQTLSQLILPFQHQVILPSQLQLLLLLLATHSHKMQPSIQCMAFPDAPMWALNVTRSSFSEVEGLSITVMSPTDQIPTSLDRLAMMETADRSMAMNPLTRSLSQLVT